VANQPAAINHPQANQMRLPNARPASLRWRIITSTKNELHKTENMHIFTKSWTRYILAAACNNGTLHCRCK
jgi:hypothetical protein